MTVFQAIFWAFCRSDTLKVRSHCYEQTSVFFLRIKQSQARKNAIFLTKMSKKWMPIIDRIGI